MLVTMKVLLRLFLASVPAFALTATANAALPTIHNTLIVPGKSVGAVKLCDKPAQVAAAWGGVPTKFSEAIYASKAREGSATIEFTPCLTKEQKKRREHLLPGDPEAARVLAEEAESIGVDTVILDVGRAHGVENYNTPLARFKTARGIGLGSTAKQISRAYPHLRGTRIPAQKATRYMLAGSNAYGSTATLFNVSKNRVYQIIVRGPGNT